MTIRTIQLYSAAVATTTADSSVDVIRNGMIVGVLWCLEVTAGATTTGRMKWMLRVNGSAALTGLNPQGILVSQCCIAMNIASAVQSCNLHHGVPSLGLKIGDRLNIDCVLTSTAPASSLVTCKLDILE